MRARLVVFPVRGRNWCFGRSIDRSALDSASSPIPSTLKELYNKISSNGNASKLELCIDYASDKMNRAWMGLEKAPEGSLKSKMHGLGLKLLARVKPSEMFLKSISKEVSSVEVIYPSSLNTRLVRRRLRHIAKRGSIIHRKCFYSSAALLPLTTALSVLPLPNIPFFWVLFRTYSHWRSLQGSEKLLELVSDSSVAQTSPSPIAGGEDPEGGESKDGAHNAVGSLWVLLPSEQLEELTSRGKEQDGLTEAVITSICKTYKLNTNDVLKYRDSM
ncbi:uncharacterized protein LOC115744753 [Rhodamnia argentea]|uniref:Uncharacterized protein LOC115744753 n=1 Tax=Rhodamnia argentea TaxID=178133 RepID=A0A8B8PNZ7_9MYRT|nr:uncharacterized protein LOC115744753 [Rhodamnia argentea]